MAGGRGARTIGAGAGIGDGADLLGAVEQDAVKAATETVIALMVDAFIVD